MTGVSTSHCLDNTKTERFVKVDQMQKRAGSAKQVIANARTDWANVLGAISVQLRFHVVCEVIVILNYPCDSPRNSR